MAELTLELIGRRALIVKVPRRFARQLARIAVRFHLPLHSNPQIVPYATRYWFVDNTKARRELGVVR